MQVYDSGYVLPNGELAILMFGKPQDGAFVWDAVKDVRSIFFDDFDEVTDRRSFGSWFQKAVDYCGVGITDDGEIVTCAYLTGMTKGYKASFHAVSAPRFRNPAVTIPLAQYAITHFFEQFGLQKLEAVIPMHNRISRITASKLGFKKEGRLRSHGVHEGEWIDYYIGSILRETNEV